MTDTFKLPIKLVHRLEHIASSSGRSAQTILREAVTKHLDYEEWFAVAVEDGFKSGDREGWVSHEESKTKLRARIENYKRQLHKAA